MRCSTIGGRASAKECAIRPWKFCFEPLQPKLNFERKNTVYSAVRDSTRRLCNTQFCRVVRRLLSPETSPSPRVNISCGGNCRCMPGSTCNRQHPAEGTVGHHGADTIQCVDHRRGPRPLSDRASPELLPHRIVRCATRGLTLCQAGLLCLCGRFVPVATGSTNALL